VASVRTSGRAHSLFALVDGVVAEHKDKKRLKVSVVAAN
jgi:ribosomal protein L27